MISASGINLNDRQQILKTISRLMVPSWTNNFFESPFGSLFEWTPLSKNSLYELDGILQEVMRGADALDDESLIQWVRGTYMQASNLPSWQHLSNRVKEVFVTRYGLLRADALCAGLNVPKRDIMQKTTGNLP